MHNELFKEEKRVDPNWFEEVYTHMKNSDLIAPWCSNEANEHLINYFQNSDENITNKKALCVGCGIGDDAQFLSGIGFETTAFDISKTAIELCKKRFENSDVNYLVDDLLNPKNIIKEKYDFIFELLTLQSIPMGTQDKAMKNISSLLNEQGKLLVICFLRKDGQAQNKVPPYAFRKEELSTFIESGLKEISCDILFDKQQNRELFVIEYTK